MCCSITHSSVPSPRLTWHSAWYSKHCETSIFGEEEKKVETPENRCKSDVFIETHREKEREREREKGKKKHLCIREEGQSLDGGKSDL